MHTKEYEQKYEAAVTFQNRILRHLFGANILLKAEVLSSSVPIPFPQIEIQKFRPISEGETWGGAWESGWFRLTATIPKEWTGRKLALRLNLGGEALLFDRDGTPRFAFSAGSVLGADFRKEYYCLPDCPAGQKVEFWVEAAGNIVHGLLPESDPELSDESPYGEFHAVAEIMRIGCFDHELWHLSLDMEILLDLLTVLPDHSRRGNLILEALTRAADQFAENPKNASKARAELATELARPACSSSMTVSALGHAHIDTGYMWPVRETIRKCARTFANQIDLLEKYPDYIFGASSPLHYLFVKDHYPKLYKKIQKAVRSGRWELLGGMWIEADCILSGGESLVRQFLYGKNFFRDEFGIDVKNLWLPDIFGCPASLPQISKLAGCPNFVCQKMSWNQINQFPYHAFLWRGIDGSELLTHFLPENSYIAFVRPSELVPAEKRFHENTTTDEFMSLFGIGDGGGGPKEEYLERGIRLSNLEGVPKFHFGRADAFFERLQRVSGLLPSWRGELYLENHRGTLTSQARNKRMNRKLEESVVATEMLWSSLPLEFYPSKELDRIWKIILLNQFHDILPGSSIHEVYEQSQQEYADAQASLICLQKEAASRLLQLDSGSITFFNSLNCTFCAPFELPGHWTGTGFMQGDETIAVQQEADGKYVAMLSIPPLSFITLRRVGQAEICQTSLEEEPILENKYIRYRFNSCGELISAWDKKLEKEFIPQFQTGNAFTLYVDRPTLYEAWNIDESYRKRPCDKAHSRGGCHVTRGSVRDVAEFHLQIGKSTIIQRIILGKESSRLDFVTQLDWQEERKLLRVSFPLTIHATESTSDIPFGFVRRTTHTNTSWDRARFEVPIHQYTDLSEADFGVALLNDCKYGCHLEENQIDLALMRAPKFPDWEADRGEQHFTYSFFPHAADASTAGVRDEAQQLNRPPLCFDGRAGEPEMPVHIESDGVELSALKKAEHDSCLVMRLVERDGHHTQAVIRTSRKLFESSMMEWESGEELAPEENAFYISLKPFEIKTFQLK